MIYTFTYTTYVAISLLVTLKVGNLLHRDGEVWLLSLFDSQELAIRINDLLLLGYRLVNIGYIFYSFVSWGAMSNWQVAIQVLSQKMGVIFLILSYLHYQNLFIIALLFHLNLVKKWKL